MQSSIEKSIQEIWAAQKMHDAVIGISGGIDSALVLTLLTRALGTDHVYPLFLPYGKHPSTDAQTIADWNHIPTTSRRSIDIGPFVDSFSGHLSMSAMQKGNIQARVRMILLFHFAKERNALVCGTENKSEHYLGYFTRFGDGASDVEPIRHLYKTQVRQMARELGLPEIFLTKAPSADLWDGQTDEAELGFSYEQADRALAVLLGESSEKVDPIVLEKVKKRVESQAFKRNTPYVPIINSTISPSAMI